MRAGAYLSSFDSTTFNSIPHLRSLIKLSCYCSLVRESYDRYHWVLLVVVSSDGDEEDDKNDSFNKYRIRFPFQWFCTCPINLKWLLFLFSLNRAVSSPATELLIGKTRKHSFSPQFCTFRFWKQKRERKMSVRIQSSSKFRSAGHISGQLNYKFIRFVTMWIMGCCSLAARF